jgi:signal transduction histidine kinase
VSSILWSLLLLAVGGLVTRMVVQRRVLQRRNAELLALHEAALDIHRDTSLSDLLQRAVDRARVLVGARYGALSVFGEDGHLRSFLVSGVTEEELERLGDTPPSHRGVLGQVTHGGRTLRLRDLTEHPAFTGYPPGHPPMRSLLAVPILCSGPFRGNFYLAEREESDEFSTFDQRSLERFATQTAIAIDNLYLSERSRSLAVAEERLRIAHEMHDGFAQVLASVNAQAQAAALLLRRGSLEEVGRQLDQMAEAAREVYGDVREGILALRASTPPVGEPERPFGATLAQFVEQWRSQIELEMVIDIDPAVTLPPAAALQVLRIAQESLANVRKHARARSARIVFGRLEDRLMLEVVDDGVGIETSRASRQQAAAVGAAEEAPRFGLATMRERARSIGGELTLGPGPDGGTRVLLTLDRPLGGMTRFA